MGHNKRPRYNSDNASVRNPTMPNEKQKETAATQPQTSTKNSQSEKRFWGMNIFERIMAVLTLAGVVIAVLTGLIFWKQLIGMRTDQRAWINISAGKSTVAETPAGATVTIPVTITNTGKTPAKAAFTEVVVEKVKNGESPEFIYEGRARNRESSGLIFPNTPVQLTAQLLATGEETSPGVFATVPALLTHSQYQDLVDGTYYLAIYAQSSYVDVFDTNHWVHYCGFGTLSPVPKQFTAKACTDYNDVDKN